MMLPLAVTETRAAQIGMPSAPVASLVAGALSDTFGPRAIFALMATMVGVALLRMPLTRWPAGNARDSGVCAGHRGPDGGA